MRSLSFGAVLWDVVGETEYIGGAPFNFAAHLAKLGCESFMCTRVGHDKRGLNAIHAMKEIDVKTDLVQMDGSRPTGIVEVTLSSDGSPSYLLHDHVAYDAIEFDDKQLGDVMSQTFDVFYFGTFEQRTEFNRKTLGRLLSTINTRHIFLDINLRSSYYSKAIIEYSLHHCSILKLNDSEMNELSTLLYAKRRDGTDLIERLMQDYSVEIVCITQGADGCSIYRGGVHQQIPGIKTDVLDTIGAGDAFSAAFVYKYCSLEDPYKSAIYANHLGAFVASSRGAIPEYNQSIKQLMRG